MLLPLSGSRRLRHRRTLSVSQVSRLAWRAQLAVIGLILLVCGYIIYVYSRAFTAGSAPILSIQRDVYAYAPHERPQCGGWRRWQHKRFAEVTKANKTVFLAANFWNNEEVLPTFFQELPILLSILGPKNVFVSVYENGSVDKTHGLMNLLDEALDIIGTPHRIISESGGQDSHKIPGQRLSALVTVRNNAMEPLYSGAAASHMPTGTFDEVLFMNDIYFCATDILELFYHKRRQGANQVCATDWAGPVVYDRWVLRAMNGRTFYDYEELVKFVNEPDVPVPTVLSHDEQSRTRFIANLPLQVFSCWNGATVMDAAPFLSSEDPLRFRMSRADVDEEGNRRNTTDKASECFLTSVDLWHKGFGRIALIPKASVAYDLQNYNRFRKDKLAPSSKTSEKITWLKNPPPQVQMQDYAVWYQPERWAPWDEQ